MGSSGAWPWSPPAVTCRLFLCAFCALASFPSFLSFFLLSSSLLFPFFLSPFLVIPGSVESSCPGSILRCIIHIKQIPDMHKSRSVNNFLVLTEAPRRRGILRGVTHTSWGLEVGVLRMTHDAMIPSLLRYGVVLAGSCFPPALFRRINTQIVNIAARRAGRLRRTTRIQGHLSGVGTMTY